MIFGIYFLPITRQDYYFDITTIVLFRRISKLVNESDHVLDLGAGAHATVGLSMWKKVGCKVTCCEINPELVSMAGKNIKRNNSPIQIIQSNLFTEISDAFNIVIFNPPYMPTEIGDRWANMDTRRVQWDGGVDGKRVINSFLEALSRREHHVTAYLGVNSRFISREHIESTIQGLCHLSLAKTMRSRILPVDIHVIQNLQAASARN